MSIKDKIRPPPIDDSPPFKRDTPCWGCGRLFDFMEFLAYKQGLCDRCFRIVRGPA